MPTAYHVVLTVDDIARVRDVARRRNDEADAAGYQPAYGYTSDRDPLADHVQGAAGELAVCKLMGLDWEGRVNNYKRGGDVKDWEVRCTPLDGGSLLIRPDARPFDTYILVKGTLPFLVVCGWMLAHDARRPEWKRSPSGRPAAYFVPQSALTDMEELGPGVLLPFDDDEQQPPEYRGRSWPQVVRDGKIDSRHPPYRWAAQESLTAEFEDFRRYHIEQVMANHPEYLCARCRTWLVSRTGNVCGHCRVKEQGGRQPRLEGTQNGAGVTSGSARTVQGVRGQRLAGQPGPTDGSRAPFDQAALFPAGGAEEDGGDPDGAER